MFYVHFEEMAIAHMYRNSHGRHAMSQETSKQSSFSLFCLIMPLSILLTTEYVRITIELNPISKRFITQLRNKHTIVREGTVHHSNRSTVGVMTSA